MRMRKIAGRTPELLDPRRHIPRAAGPAPGSRGLTASLAMTARLLELLGRPVRGADRERAGARWVGAPGAVIQQVSDVREGAPKGSRKGTAGKTPGGRPAATVTGNSGLDAAARGMRPTL